MSPPLQLTGVWQMESIEQADHLLADPTSGFVYRRDSHPNAADLETCMRQLHRCDEAIVTAQGMSALAAVCLAILQPGDLVLLGQPLYGKTTFLIRNELSRWGIQSEDVDATDLSDWTRAIAKHPRLIILESICNPRLAIPDIEAICALAHNPSNLSERRCEVLVDNTFATPVLCRPLELGADMVMESLSKFVCGHGDAMLGFLGGKKEFWNRIRSVVSAFGLASSPLDCWLTQRGLQSLEVRMERAARSALELARYFEKHPAIEQLDYPGLEAHSTHETAKRQLSGAFGNMLTIRLRDGTNQAPKLIAALQDTIPFCPSLGDTHTTLSHPASTSHRAFTPAELLKFGIDQGTIRFSIGLEPYQDLIARLEDALRLIG